MLRGGNHCSPTTVIYPLSHTDCPLSRWLPHFNRFISVLAGDSERGSAMAGAGAPIRQDSRKFFENLSGAGKSIAVLTSGGDAQGNSL